MPTPGAAVVRIAPNNPVFDLPVIVGIEEGLFEAAGLDVAFSATYADRESDRAGQPIMARLKEQMFECGAADSYNVCEWASIDRLERGTRAGQYCGSARGRCGAGDSHVRRVAASAARSRRRPGRGAAADRLALLHASDARERDWARARQDRAGGLPQTRWAALESGSIKVATLMEPFISLALKHGAHVVAACFYRGGEVISAALTADAAAGVLRGRKPRSRPHQRRLLQVPRTTSRRMRKGRSNRTSCCARSCGISTSTSTIRRCSRARMTG